MQLTLEQAAERLGKSVRQVRYLIQNGGLTAQKAGSRWVVREEDLPRTSGQVQAAERREDRLREAVDTSLGIDRERKRFSVGDLKAFQLALPIHRQAVTLLGDAHPAVESLRRALDDLAQGCHRFDRQEKALA